MKKNRIKKDANLEGQVFGLFTVLSSEPSISGWNVRLWKCQCRCGEIRIYSSTQLKYSTSCGCLKKARMKKLRVAESEKTIKYLKNSIYSQYARRAYDKGREFSIPRDIFFDLMSHNCHYCGSLPSNTVKSNGYMLNYNGIDRIDSNLGYTVPNSVPCCKICNGFKSNMSTLNFILAIKTIYNNISNSKVFSDVMKTQQNYVQYTFNVDDISDIIPDEG